MQAALAHAASIRLPLTIMARFLFLSQVRERISSALVAAATLEVPRRSADQHSRRQRQT
jgi:hypothetical protein